MTPAIQTEGLTKQYRGLFSSRTVRAVENISLEVQPQSVFGLLGPNGSGKTTFIKMLLSAVRPTAGRGSLFGRDCRQPAARRAVGYLPENHRFPTYNTGRQMLDFYAALSGMLRAERKQRAGELLERVGLTEWADVRIGKYSKGMLQRLGLAQALMHRPSLLMLDEPGDGVDPLGRRLIRDILDEARSQGATVFLNSHLLAEVELFCEEVAIIRRGELVLTGRLAELTRGSGYRLTASRASDNLLNELRPKAASIAFRDGLCELQFSDREAVNQAIDLLRREGAQIEEIERRRSTLEDVFIRTVEETKQEPAEAAQGTP